MTDPNLADATYIEPLTKEYLKLVIKKEKSQMLFCQQSVGKTALNLALELYKNGFLNQHKVELIGAQAKAIEKAEDREKFKKEMDKVGIDTALGGFVNSYMEAKSLLSKISFPIIIRPSFTMGGTGGSIAYNKEEFQILWKKDYGLVQLMKS